MINSCHDPRDGILAAVLIPRPTKDLPELPDLAAHRQLTPGILDLSPQDEEYRQAQKRRRLIGFIVAALLHAVAILVFFLTPALRLKTNPAPERWMPVVSLPAPGNADPRAAAAPHARPDASAAPDPRTPAASRAGPHPP